MIDWHFDTVTTIGGYGLMHEWVVRDIIPELDKRFRYEIEVRDNSWFQDLAYSFFANNNIWMVWSQLAGIRTLPIVTGCSSQPSTTSVGI